MQFDVLTLFPGMFEGPLTESVLKRGREKGLLVVRLHDLRAFAHDRHRQVDDTPYGGGGGMVLMPGPVFEGVETIQREYPAQRGRVILLSPQGRPFSHDRAMELARDYDRLLLICGRYEGVDERVREFLAEEEISIGDYVLTGGELPAMVLIDAVSRQVPGVLGSSRSAEEDSFACGGLEYPQYTKPATFRGRAVPEVLLSGNHSEIDAWRRRKAREATESKRPDLMEEADEEHLRFSKR
jgi:tRNA (guanine37-N1)-methyltransferase